jgi:hypothetical protein
VHYEDVIFLVAVVGAILLLAAIAWVTWKAAPGPFRRRLARLAFAYFLGQLIGAAIDAPRGGALVRGQTH